MVGAAQWLPALDVGLVVKQDADEALAALRYARRAIVTLGGATVALLAATGFVFARSRRQAEASDRRQRSILDNTSAAVALKGRDGAYLVANQAWLRVLQRPESQVLGRRDEDVLPFEAASRRQALERQVLESGRPVEATEDWTIDGAVRHFLTVVFPVRGESNERHRPRRHLDRHHDAGGERAAARGALGQPRAHGARSAPPSSRSPRSAAG